MPSQPSQTTGLAGRRSEHDEIALSSKPEAPDVTKEKAAPGVAVEASSALPPPNPDVGEAKDAAYYRQRGRLAYRDGDLSLALIDFDRAISLDPNLTDAYVDRAIVFSRMGDLKRAFADIAQAKQIGNLGRTQGSALKPPQASPLSANN
jgi:Flp pilus assembly protein TadD